MMIQQGTEKRWRYRIILHFQGKFQEILFLKCINYSKNCSSDEKSTCFLLEKNLNTYYHSLDKNSSANRVKNILEKHKIALPTNVKSSLNEIDLNTIVQRPSCFDKNAFRCPKSENISSTDFNKFSDALLQKSKPEDLGCVQKQRKISKNFAPQTCKQDTRITRANSDDNLKTTTFKTAREELNVQNLNKNQNSSNSGAQKRRLGIRRTVNAKFVPPLLSNNSEEALPKSEEWPNNNDIEDERLKNIDPKMVELIKSEIMDVGATITWTDIAGLEFAKTAIQEAVVWPMLRPDIFTGLRRPPKGILLFGPPGTGKTLIGKCVASQSKSTFFSISASSLTSKWVGDGEKMVRALFAVARVHQPSVSVFYFILLV